MQLDPAHLIKRMPEEPQSPNPYAAPEVPTHVAVNEENYPDAEWMHLITNPRRFFQHLKKFRHQNGVVLVFIWVVGMAGVIDRLSAQTARGRSFDFMMDDWGAFWLAVSVGGIVAGAVDWLIGGFLFHIRVSWAGDPQRDKTDARLIYIFTSALIAVPTLALTALETATYASYRESFDFEDIDAMYLLYLFVFAGMFYSLYVSYKGVMERFQVNPRLTALWFLILPGLLYGGVAVATFAVALTMM